MPSNNTGFACGYLAGRFPGRIGHLFNTDGWTKNPTDFAPWALDNGAYAAFDQKRPWDEKQFYDRLAVVPTLASPPLWVIVPDVVTDRAATLAAWKEHAPRIAAAGYRLAMAVQDGMTADDVPPAAAVVFVGGSTGWKWRNLRHWTTSFPRVHVGRVNTEKYLWRAHEAGAESCDGTGFFRGRREQLDGLIRYLEQSSGTARTSDEALGQTRLFET